MKKVVVLGATGSVGSSSIAVIRDLAEVELVAVSGWSDCRATAEIANEFGCRRAVIADECSHNEFSKLLDSGIEPLYGNSGLVDIVTDPEVDMVICAIAGSAALESVFAAVKAGKDIALATKEVLVVAGEYIMAEAELSGSKIFPVDSEHSAIFQCLNGENSADISRIILTGSGGPFRSLSANDLLSITPEQALDHPKWNMGKKITIDSATLMNKGLELIEAVHLFSVPSEKVEVIIHPEAIIHSMVEFYDGSVMAQLAQPDMRLPVHYALTYPNRCQSKVPTVDFTKLGALTFEKPNPELYKMVELAIAAVNNGGAAPAILNAANEVAVWQFLANKIAFNDIYKIVHQQLSLHSSIPVASIDDLIEVDRFIRKNI